MTGIEMILVWVLISCFIFLGISHSMRTLDHEPIEEWDVFGWIAILSFSIIFPLGLFALCLVYEGRIRRFLFKERSWEPLKDKQDMSSFE